MWFLCELVLIAAVIVGDVNHVLGDTATVIELIQLINQLIDVIFHLIICMKVKMSPMTERSMLTVTDTKINKQSTDRRNGESVGSEPPVVDLAKLWKCSASEYLLMSVPHFSKPSMGVCKL